MHFHNFDVLNQSHAAITDSQFARSGKIDKELRNLRETELPKASAHAIKAAVQQCLKQKQVHDERIQSGASVCEWLRTPGLHKGGCTFHGAVSLGGPATEPGLALDATIPAAQS